MQAATDASAKRRGALLTITAFWIGASILVQPRLNFPLNDDWSYGWAVRTLVEDHRWRLADFTSMPVGPQILWGALFSLPLGFSFDALRLSTIVLAWLMTVGVYALSIETGAAGPVALLAALSIAANPITFALSYTFMTDVPFLAAVVWAFVFLVKYLRRDRMGDAVAAVALFTCATLIRQTGLLLALGAACASILANRRQKRSVAALLSLMPGLSLLLYGQLLRATHVPTLYGDDTVRLAEALALDTRLLMARVANRCGQVFVYTGVFALPVALATDVASQFRRRPRAWVLVVACIVTATAGLIANGHRMPLSGNILNDVTLLPIMMNGAGNRPHAPTFVWVALTAIGVVTAALVFTAIALGMMNHTRIGSEDTVIRVLFIAAGLLYIAPSFFTLLFDRYLLVWFVCVAQVLLSTAAGINASTRRLSVAGALVAVMALSSIGLTHDALALNRARWAAVNAALMRGEAPLDIDGGFEVNAWLADAKEALRLSNVNRPVVLSLTRERGFVVEDRHAFQRWLPWESAEVVTLRSVVDNANRR